MSESAIEVRDVSYRYSGASASAIEGVSLIVRRGEMLAIVGPNGGGKTTLLSLVLGLIEPTRGQVRVLDGGASVARRAGRFGVVLQGDTIERRFPIRAQDVVRLAVERPRARSRKTSADADRAVAESLERAGALDLSSESISSLSRGELQRVLLARALAPQPEILILDEPLVGVDAAGSAAFGTMLGTLHRELGLTILLVSHDLRTIATGGSSCDRVACLNRTLHFHDAPSGITPQILAEVFHHDLASVFGDVHVDAHRADECETEHRHAGTDGAGDDAT